MKSDLKNRRLVVLLLIAGLVLVSLSIMRRCTTSRSTLADSYLKPNGDTIAVAIEMSPLTYTFRNDTADGFDYQLLVGMARAHGAKVEFRPFNDLDCAFRGLNDGEYDMVVASFPSTKALKEYFPLTDAVYIDRQVLVQRCMPDGQAPVRTLQQLRGDTVWISAGSPFRTRLSNLAAELGDSIIIEPEEDYSAEQLVIMTALGKIPRAVVNESVARHLARDYTDLDISVPVSLSQFQVWAVAPGDSTLLDTINTWLREYRRTAAYDSLAAEWL